MRIRDGPERNKNVRQQPVTSRVRLPRRRSPTPGWLAESTGIAKSHGAAVRAVPGAVTLSQAHSGEHGTAGSVTQAGHREHRIAEVARVPRARSELPAEMRALPRCPCELGENPSERREAETARQGRDEKAGAAHSNEHHGAIAQTRACSTPPSPPPPPHKALRLCKRSECCATLFWFKSLRSNGHVAHLDVTV
ncbi:unnamed protein product [Lampetra planeri]